MALKLGTLFYDIGANTRKLHDAQQEVSRVNGRMSSSFRRLGGIIAAAFSLDAIRRVGMLANRIQLLDIRVKNMTKSHKDFVKSQMELLRISSLTGTSLTNNVRLFEALAIAAKDVGASNTQVLVMVEALRKIGVVGGTGLEQMNNAILQFGQAMAGGIVRAEEFNSIVENMPLLAKAIADGMDTTVGKLRKTILDPNIQLKSEQVFNSILKQTSKIDKQFEQMPLTMERAWESFQSNSARAIADFDNVAGTTGIIADLIMKASNFMKDDFLVGSFEVAVTIKSIAFALFNMNKVISDATINTSALSKMWLGMLSGLQKAPAFWSIQTIEAKSYFQKVRVHFEKLGLWASGIGTVIKQALFPDPDFDVEDQREFFNFQMRQINKRKKTKLDAIDREKQEELDAIAEIEKERLELLEKDRIIFDKMLEERAQAEIKAAEELAALKAKLATGGGKVAGDTSSPEKFQLNEFQKLMEQMGAVQQEFLNQEAVFQARISEITKEGTDERKHAEAVFADWRRKHAEQLALDLFLTEKQRQLMTFDAVSNFNTTFLDMLTQAGKEHTALARAMFYASKAIQVATIIAETEVAAAKVQGQLGIFGIPLATIIRTTGFASAATVAGLAIGGGRLAGGDVFAGKMHPINEDGAPEILHQGARQFLLPGSKGGTVTPVGMNTGGSSKPEITIINNGAPITVTDTRFSNDELIIMINNAKTDAIQEVNSSLSTGRGSTATALNHGFKTERNL